VAINEIVGGCLGNSIKVSEWDCPVDGRHCMYDEM
jgi:hypothetical protein